MIATLTGRIADISNQTIIECAGVGYGVILTASDSGRLNLAETATFYIHEHIKEDAHDLYGFLQKPTMQLFEQLLSVKNVGPKVALSVLDIGSLDAVRAAIAEGNVKHLQTAKGVGKRAAEQIVVELRDKVGAPVSDTAESLVYRSGINVQDEALQALLALGYSESDAAAALHGVDTSLSTEDRIKLALRGSK